MTDGGSADRPPQLNMRTSRLEAFSDGVFAIAVTLLVLDLVVPEAEVPNPGAVLLQQWPIYLAYVVSFASIGAAWLSHSIVTDYLERTDSIVLRLNLLLLFFVSLLPFPTHMLATFVHNVDAERIASAIYGFNLLAMAALTSMIWHYAVSEKLIQADADEEELRALTAKVEPSLVSYLVAIAIGLVLPRLAVALYLVIALYVMIPFRAIARWTRRRKTPK